MDAPLLETVGLRPHVVSLLRGNWSPWGAPQLPTWLREVWPAPIGGWTAGMVQALRADYVLEFAGQRSDATAAHQRSLEQAALSQLAWAVLGCPPQ
eukprot:10943110-Alexandrium_andersonii.AAC.1